MSKKKTPQETIIWLMDERHEDCTVVLCPYCKKHELDVPQQEDIIVCECGQSSKIVPARYVDVFKVYNRGFTWGGGDNGVSKGTGGHGRGQDAQSDEEDNKSGELDGPDREHVQCVGTDEQSDNRTASVKHRNKTPARGNGKGAKRTAKRKRG